MICGIKLHVSDLADYFKLLLNPQPTTNNFLFAEPLIYNESLDREISMSELSTALLKAANNKAPGPDRISNEFYKNAPTEFQIRMLEMFNYIYETGEIPQSFKDSIVYPIFK